MSIEMAGLDDLAAGLEAQFAQLEGAETKRAMRRGLYAGAKLVRDEARRRAPEKSGLLRQSIRAGSKNGRGATLAEAGVYFAASTGTYTNSKRNRRLGRVGDSYAKSLPSYYWRFIELGTSHQRAEPFLRPAFDHNRERIDQVVADRLSAAIDEALGSR